MKSKCVNTQPSHFGHYYIHILELFLKGKQELQKLMILIII